MRDTRVTPSFVVKGIFCSPLFAADRTPSCSPPFTIKISELQEGRRSQKNAEFLHFCDNWMGFYLGEKFQAFKKIPGELFDPIYFEPLLCGSGHSVPFAVNTYFIAM